MLSAVRLTVLCALCLMSCAQPERSMGDGSPLGAGKPRLPIQCDMLISGVCVMRPGEDYNLTVVELRRAMHGRVLKVELHESNGGPKITAIVNQLVGVEARKSPPCDVLGIPECENVIYSQDKFYPVIFRAGRGETGLFSGIHVDVIEASVDENTQKIVNSAFSVCHIESSDAEIRCD